MSRLFELLVADLQVSFALDTVEPGSVLCAIEPLGKDALPRLSELLVGAVPVSSALDTVEAEYLLCVVEPRRGRCVKIILAACRGRTRKLCVRHI